MSGAEVRGTKTAAIVASVAAAVLAPFIAWRTGDSYGAYLALDALAGAVTGALTAALVSALVKRLRTTGYVLAIGVLVVLLVLTGYLATSTDYMAVAVTIAFLAPVYALSVMISCALIRPVRPDKARSKASETND
ncbi:MAG: hypothetical protein IT209_12805 [Armatimonadetes bacterium]|nr:hypothetical protein [Armatimonadota bacterium]